MANLVRTFQLSRVRYTAPIRGFHTLRVIGNRPSYTLARQFHGTPEEFYVNVVHSYFLPHAIYVTCQLKLADSVPSRPATVIEIAASAKTDPERTDRLLKYLAVYGVFDCVAPGVYRHNARSELLKTQHPRTMWPLVMFRNEIGAKASLEWAAAIRGECITPFNKAFNTNLDFWAFLCQPENSTLKSYFDGAMVSTTNHFGEGLIKQYPWRQHPLAHVIDVGGGLGHLLAAVLREYKDFTGVVFDLQKTVETAKDHWKREFSDVESRVGFCAGSFFEKIPEGGDVYMLKHIIHDWNDSECVQILKSVAQAMRATKASHPLKCPYVLIFDRLYDFPPKYNSVADMDMMMMTLISGRERSLEEFKELFHKAGLKFSMSMDFKEKISAIRGELDN